MIYVSSAVIKDQPAWKTSIELFNHGIKNIELSGGKYDEDQLINLKKLKSKINFQLHNYFPPPLEPFVFNLASLSPDVVNRSLQHVETALQFSVELDCPRFSFHAGYLIDPQISEIGSNIKNRKIYDRKEAIKIFIENINFISNRASKLGVSLLIENNVISFKNYKEFKCNPFLMVETDECLYVMDKTPSNINLLIDVAHLNVSSKTMGFDKKLFVQNCYDHIQAYHLSDNKGTKDDNEPISIKSWFWDYIKHGLDYYSLEIYGLKITELKKQFNLAKQIIENKSGS